MKKKKKIITKKKVVTKKITPKREMPRKDKSKLKWYILIAIALFVGVIMGYFATQSLATTGAANAIFGSKVNGIIVTLQWTGSNIVTSKVANIQNTELSSVPVQVERGFKLTLKSTAGIEYGSQTFDISSNQNNTQVTLALNPGIEYDSSTNHLIANGTDVGVPAFVIAKKRT